VLTSGRIDSRRALYEAGPCVTLERRGMARAEISSAVHEPNSGYRRGKIKQARPSVWRCVQARRVGTISEHVFSPSVREGIGAWVDRPVPAAEDVTAWAGAL
jgi:hypothetical protein